MPASSRSSGTYLLVVLTLVYVVNFLDRQILAILTVDIQGDLGLSGAEMGALSGTAFAVVYGLSGVPLGTVADAWSRRSVVLWTLAAWSLLTVFAGVFGGMVCLVAWRIGLGIAQAGASPAAYSMVAEAFPERQRARALAVYSAGIFVGMGAASLLGGTVSDAWNGAFGDSAPLGLAGWQVAMIVAGCPGLLLLPLVFRLQELGSERSTVTWRQALEPFGPSRVRRRLLARGGISRNLAGGALLGAVAVALGGITGDWLHFGSLAVGAYVAWTWAVTSEPPGTWTPWALSARTTLAWVTLACAAISFTGYAWAAWGASFLRVRFDQSAGDVGVWLGPVKLVSGLVGILAGGWVADRVAARRGGRVLVILASALLPVPFYLAVTRSGSMGLALGWLFFANGLSTLWFAAGASLVQDLCPKERRGAISGWYLLVITFVGLGLGPYTVGTLFDHSKDLGHALDISLLASCGAAACAFWALPRVPGTRTQSKVSAENAPPGGHPGPLRRTQENDPPP